MGIPHLFKWLRGKDYRGVLRRNVPQYVSSFSLDANGILHEVAQQVYAYGAGNDEKRRKLVQKADPKMLEAEFYQALATKLTQIITQVSPQEIFVIAIDGVAPQAKIAQQRQRRFRSAMESGDNVFDSSAFTPGTEFMKRIDNFIQRWLISSAKSLPPKVIYSSHMVPGEGEHKILSLIRSGEISGNGSHVIYGMDADLIMLSLLAPIEKISLMREDISSIIDIDSLREQLKTELVSETAVEDFVVMIFLLGNDFLPHLVTLSNLDESIETMINVYKRVNESLTNNGDINWPGLSNYLTTLGEEEGRLLEMESRRDVKHPSRMMAMATEKVDTLGAGSAAGVRGDSISKVGSVSKFNLNIFRGAWYKNAFDLKGKKQVYEKLLPNHKFGSTNTKMVEMVKSYLTGMAWVYRYYRLGKEFVNNDFVYRYHYGPLISDLALVAKSIPDKFMVDGYSHNPNAIIVNPVHQLLAVLPLKSKDLLPYEVQHLTKRDSPIADYFPQSETIERDGMNTDWQGIVLINFVDMNRILEAVENTSMFTEERIREFSPTYDIILKRDPTLDDKTRKMREYLSKEVGTGGRGRGSGRGSGGRGRGGGRGGGNYNSKPRESYDPNRSRVNIEGSGGRGGGRGTGGRGRGSDYKRTGEPKKNYEKPEYKRTGEPQKLPPLPTVNVPKPQQVQKFEL